MPERRARHLLGARVNQPISRIRLIYADEKRADERTRTAYPCSSYELYLGPYTYAEKSLTERQECPQRIAVLRSITPRLVYWLV